MNAKNSWILPETLWIPTTDNLLVLRHTTELHCEVKNVQRNCRQRLLHQLQSWWNLGCLRYYVSFLQNRKVLENYQLHWGFLFFTHPIVDCQFQVDCQCKLILGYDDRLNQPHTHAQINNTSTRWSQEGETLCSADNVIQLR